MENQLFDYTFVNYTKMEYPTQPDKSPKATTEESLITPNDGATTTALRTQP